MNYRGKTPKKTVLRASETLQKQKIRINKKKPRRTHLLFLLKNPLCLYGVTFRYPIYLPRQHDCRVLSRNRGKKIKRSTAYKTPIRFVLLAAPVLINQNQNKYREQYCCHNFLLDITKIHV